MLRSVAKGRPGTAMKGFANVLSEEEIALVVDFVRREFMVNQAPNTRYHTAENGWPNQQQYAPAYPFALGEIPLDTPSEQLTPEQQLGLRIFMQSCVTCHDRAKVRDEGVIWDTQAVSYPRGAYSHRETERQTKLDAETSATPYAQHDIKPEVDDLTAQEQRGEQLFQANCAFCHGADGTGKNWIGTFLEPHPRNLTDPEQMAGMTREHVRQVIREGLPGTTMSAWQSVLSETDIENIISYINKVFHRVLEVKTLDKAAAP
jgi:cytochrome c oxidase cbb3-type subunit 3